MKLKTIKFKLPWRGREPGQLDNKLDFGVSLELVRRGIAEYVEAEQADKQPAKEQKRKGWR